MTSRWIRGTVICGAVAAAAALMTSSPAAQQPARAQQQTPAAVFRSSREVITVDAIVRDKSGAVVRGLTADDFEIREDGQPQQILNFSFEEIREKAPNRIETAELLAGVDQKLQEQVRPTASAAPAAAPAAAPINSETMAGRRLITLLFDTSSMQPDDVQRAVDSAQKYVSEKMSPADLVAVVTINSSLNVLTDFTADRARVASALASLGYTEGTATPPPDASTAASDEAAAAATDDTTTTDTSDMDMFNNDIRLRALKTIADTLAPIEQKKSIIYFSAGMQRSGQDNQVELRSAINSAVRANVSFYPIDTRGLQAVVPGGDARQASGRGNAMFSGRGVAQQYDTLAGSQDTLTTLAANTGGRAFTDTNDFGEAFARVQNDMSAYYLLAYSSSNTVHDGRYRRIEVRVKRSGLKVESRSGYYAERDFVHTSRGDRETQLQDQLFAAVSATDVPVMVTAGWFRIAADKYYVPIAVAVPGSAIPAGTDATKLSLDVLGMVRDEQGRPLGRFRETMQLPPDADKTLAGKQVLYQSGVTLPPGRYTVKAVVRENSTGLMGTFEAPVIVPELKKEEMKVSSVVLSTQVEPAPKGKTDNPLVRQGEQLVPNITHVVGRDQKLFFYYEVYDPAQAAGSAPELRTSLAFYRGKVKVYETPVVDRTTIDAPDRRAALFQFEVPADAFTPGLYTCQINIIDTVAGHFAFPRLLMFVR